MVDRLKYDKLVADALRGVVRQALREVATHGLPGSHHFFIAFRTAHPAADLADWLKQKYPDEMTIVLEHQFWGLEVEDDRFTVTLSFNNRQERLVVPFAAVVGFSDPSVKFSLQFDAEGARKREPKDVARPADERLAEQKSAPVVALDAFRKK